MPAKIKRFRLKPNADISSVPENSHLSFVNKKATRGFWKPLRGSVDVNIAFPEDLSEWNDFEYVLVLDNDFGQPYLPFYSYLNREINCFKFLAGVVEEYNSLMESLPYMEEVKEND